MMLFTWLSFEMATKAGIFCPFIPVPKDFQLKSLVEIKCSSTRRIPSCSPPMTLKGATSVVLVGEERFWTTFLTFFGALGKKTTYS